MGNDAGGAGEGDLQSVCISSATHHTRTCLLSSLFLLWPSFWSSFSSKWEAWAYKLPAALFRGQDASFTPSSLYLPFSLIPSLFVALSSHLQACTSFSVTPPVLGSLFLCSLLFQLPSSCWWLRLLASLMLNYWHARAAQLYISGCIRCSFSCCGFRLVFGRSPPSTPKYLCFSMLESWVSPSARCVLQSWCSTWKKFQDTRISALPLI